MELTFAVQDTQIYLVAAGLSIRCIWISVQIDTNCYDFFKWMSVPGKLVKIINKAKDTEEWPLLRKNQYCFCKGNSCQSLGGLKEWVGMYVDKSDPVKIIYLDF